MRRIDYLITDVRLQTENEDFSDTVGISDTEFLRFINEGQDRLQARIAQQHNSIFLSESTYNIVGSQESYTLPSDIFLGNRVTQVDYSPSSDTTKYMPLAPATLRTRNSGTGTPASYIRQSGTILVNPVSSSSTGLLRVTYHKKLAKLDIRRGSILTFTDSGTQVTALSLDVTTDSVDTTATDKDNFLCIVGRDGTIKMKNIEYDSISGTTGVVTLTASHTYETGETLAIGDYIVVGKDTTTHSELPDHVERYLIAYASWKILKRDSSVDYTEQESELSNMEQEIVETYADISDDIYQIPEVNDDEAWL